MLTDNLEQLAEVFGTTLCCRTALCQNRTALDDLPLCQALVRLLAAGQPLSYATLAAATGLSEAEIQAAIRRNVNVEYDQAGRIIGAGLTLRPTPHRFQVDDRMLYTWCALDALMYPSVLGREVRVESPCAATGVAVRATLTPDSVMAVSPADAVVSLVIPAAGQEVRQAFCNDVHFFSSAQAARVWLARHSGAVVLPVAAAYELGRLLAARRCCPP